MRSFYPTVRWWWSPWARISLYREKLAETQTVLDQVTRERNSWRESWARESRALRDAHATIAELKNQIAAKDLQISLASKPIPDGRQRELPLTDAVSKVTISYGPPSD